MANRLRCICKIYVHGITCIRTRMNDYITTLLLYSFDCKIEKHTSRIGCKGSAERNIPRELFVCSTFLFSFCEIVVP